MSGEKVISSNKYDTVIKTLRRREISCLVTAVSYKNRKENASSNLDSMSIESSSNLDSKSKSPVKEKEKTPDKRRYRKKESHFFSSASPIKSNSCISNLDDNALFTPPQEVFKTRKYRKKDSHSFSSASPIKSNLCISNLDNNALLNPPQKIFKTRKYRKKDSHSFSSASPIKSNLCISNLDDNALLNPPQKIFKTRKYRKKVHVVPPNTPVSFESNTDNQSTSSQTSGVTESSNHNSKEWDGLFPKKRSAFPLSISMVDEELSCSSTMSKDSEITTPRRGRRRRWNYCFLDVCDEEEEEHLSEYDLQRLKNIEENRKVLKQMMSEMGFQLETKSSESSKVRKSKSKALLPPPRPKSARIEVKRSNQSLDFSNLNNRLSLI